MFFLFYIAWAIFPRRPLAVPHLKDETAATSPEIWGEDKQGARREGLILCLSGGGYRAMLFHLGSLWRLNEAGLLPTFDRVSSVSGGSIVAGLLASKWHDLSFDSDGFASNLEEVVARPLRRLASRTSDRSAIIFGLITHEDAASYLADMYRTEIVGDRSLGSLPEHPDFRIYATNLNNGRPWQFGKTWMGDSELKAESDMFPIAAAIAASSAFPPFLSPFEIDVRDGSFSRKVMLADGGVYDNLGLTRAQGYRTVFVSDASASVIDSNDLGRSWLSQLPRAIDLIYRQPGLMRIENLEEILKGGQATGAYWTIRDNLDERSVRSDLCFPKDISVTLASIPTRLLALTDTEQERLVDWGYVVTDAALRSSIQNKRSSPVRFPYPRSVPPCR